MLTTMGYTVLNEYGIREAVAKMTDCGPEQVVFVLNDGELQAEIHNGEEPVGESVTVTGE